MNSVKKIACLIAKGRDFANFENFRKKLLVAVIDVQINKRTSEVHRGKTICMVT